MLCFGTGNRSDGSAWPGCSLPLLRLLPHPPPNNVTKICLGTSVSYSSLQHHQTEDRSCALYSTLVALCLQLASSLATKPKRRMRRFSPHNHQHQHQQKDFVLPRLFDSLGLASNAKLFNEAQVRSVCVCGGVFVCLLYI